jgi:predicted phage terminase large subunit-like protein
MNFTEAENQAIAAELAIALEVSSIQLSRAASRREIEYLDLKPKPLIVQVSLVEYFERIKRYKADRWQIDFCNRLQAAAENRHINRDWTIYHAEAQLGKTSILSQAFPAWLLGHDPLFRWALAMYNISRSQMHSQVVIQILQSNIHKDLFPNKDGWLEHDNVSKAGWMTHARRDLNDGQLSFNPVGLQTGLTGSGFDWLAIDDPYKESKEAFSSTVRENMANFWEYTVMSRVSPTACVTGMFHRYAPEDFAGYLLDTGDFDYVRYASQADGDYIHESTGQRFADPLGRAIGEYISPERRPPSYYEKPRKNKRVYLSMFQGRPSSEEGEFFNVSQIEIISPDLIEMRKQECVALVRAYDNASTGDGGAYTVGALMGIRPDGKITVFELLREQLDSASRLRRQFETALGDGVDVPIRIPQDPGSAGKDTVFFTTQKLEGFTVIARPTTGSKEERARNFSSAVGSGEVEFVEADWNQAAKRELRDFPLSQYKDITDAMSDGYNYLYEIFRKGLVVKNYRPQRNLVTWDTFAAQFGNKIPTRWTIYAAVKIQPEASKPSSAVIVARAPEISDLPESLFVIGEYKSYDSDFCKLFDWIEETLAGRCEDANADNTAVYLHPESEQYLTTISSKLNYRMGVFTGDTFAGITELNWYLLPKETAHPFNHLEKATGLYLLIEANQFDAPVDANGLYASRQEMKAWGYNERGEPSKTGACLDCLRMITCYFRTYSEPLTMDEEFYRLLPESAKVKKGQIITLEQHMSNQLQREIAAEKLAEKYGLIDEEAEEDGNDFYWSY